MGLAAQTNGSYSLAAVGEKRRFSFVGVSTSESAIMQLFPEWAGRLGFNDLEMVGHDLDLHAPRERYRHLVARLKADPKELGGLVTTHKIDLFDACVDLFDYIDPYANALGEVSCISKHEGLLRAHAKDPISSARALADFVPRDHWRTSGGHALLLGAGGANLAISICLMKPPQGDGRPKRVVVLDRNPERLMSMREIHDKLASGMDVEYVLSVDPHLNSQLMAEQPAGTLVVNGTGMGKDTEGSPVTDQARFPQRGLVWELNYRGARGFLQQAKRRQSSDELIVEDGWRYFLHGWTCAIEEVLDVEIHDAVFDDLAAMAERIRPADDDA